MTTACSARRHVADEGGDAHLLGEFGAVPDRVADVAANAARPAGGGSRWLGMAEYRPPISSSKLRRAV